MYQKTNNLRDLISAICLLFFKQVVRAKERLDMEMREQGQKTFEKDDQTNNQEKPS